MDIERAKSLLCKAMRVMGPTACESNVDVRAEIGNFLATHCPNGVGGVCPLCGGAAMVETNEPDGIHQGRCAFCNGTGEVRSFSEPAQKIADEMVREHLAGQEVDANAREPSWESKAGAPPPPKEPSKHLTPHASSSPKGKKRIGRKRGH